MTEPLYLISAIVRQAGLGDGMRCKCATKADVGGITPGHRRRVKLGSQINRQGVIYIYIYID